MIGVMVSAVFPGRLGEAARAIVVARRVGSIALVAGTILSQTMLKLVALVALGAAVITSTGVLSAPVGALWRSAPSALRGPPGPARLFVLQALGLRGAAGLAGAAAVLGRST